MKLEKWRTKEDVAGASGTTQPPSRYTQCIKNFTSSYSWARTFTNVGVQGSSEMVSVKGVAVKESFLKNINSKIRQKLYWKSVAAGLMERSVQILHIWFKSSLIYTGEKYNSECLQPSIEHSGGFVMFWSWISSRDAGDLVKLVESWKSTIRFWSTVN